MTRCHTKPRGPRSFLTVSVLVVGNVTAAGGVEEREHSVDILLREKRGLQINVVKRGAKRAATAAAEGWERQRWGWGR